MNVNWQTFDKKKFVSGLRGQFLLSLKREREKQDGEWGEEHDDAHYFDDWVALITKHAGRVVSLEVTPENELRFRRQMIIIAALAMAGWEASERRRATAEMVAQAANSTKGAKMDEKLSHKQLAAKLEETQVAIEDLLLKFSEETGLEIRSTTPIAVGQVRLFATLSPTPDGEAA